MAFITGTAGPDTINDTTGNDIINALDGDDTINITGGQDLVDAGNGDDTVVIDYSDSDGAVTTSGRTGAGAYTFTQAGTSNTVQVSGVENIDITTGGGNDIIITFNDPNSSGDDVVDTGAGDDIIYTGAGADTIDGGDGNDLIAASTGDDDIMGGAGDDRVIMNVSFDGADTIDTGEGADRVELSADDSVGDQIRITFASDEVGNGAADDGSDDGADDGDLAVHIQQEDGADALTGAESRSDDEGVVFVAGAGMTLDIRDIGGTERGDDFTAAHLGTDGADAMVATTLNVYMNGGAGADSLNGNSGDDFLVGGAGADQMRGGLGDDTYVYTAGDFIGENANGGTDTVLSDVTYSAVVNIENVMLTGVGNINAFGNTLQNQIVGNAGDNLLNGGGGKDFIYGGLGNDRFFVDDIGDLVSEDGAIGAANGWGASGGTDTVVSTINYTLGVDIENLQLVGTANLNGNGNTLDNELLGNVGNNTLNGGLGADTMEGLAGNDVYVVDNAGDVVTEAANGGTDSVTTVLDAYTLAANVETLRLAGAVVSGTGNALNNTIYGNAVGNTIDGGLGADAMLGGAGDDTYVVDNAGDTVVELAAEGTDLVNASVSFSLGVNVENLTLTGADNISGIGNTLANTITGNIGNNFINGGAGADTMIGGLGNDRYIVDNAGDTVTEALAGGTDSVGSTVSYTLGANVEDLDLLGSASISGTGNADANVIRGNSAANSIDGGDGDDTLSGFGGNDTIIGGLGADTINGGAGADTLTGGGIALEADTFVFSSASDTTTSNFDRIVDFEDDVDTIDLLAIDADTTTAGNQDFDVISGAFSGTAGELLVSYDSVSGATIIQGDTNGDGAADFRIDLLGGDFTGATGVQDDLVGAS